jgi:hypothetical protein
MGGTECPPSPSWVPFDPFNGGCGMFNKKKRKELAVPFPALSVVCVAEYAGNCPLLHHASMCPPLLVLVYIDRE